MVVRKEGTHPIYQEFAEALDLVEAKAHDYAEDDNVFSNFEFAASVAGVEPEQVFAVLLGVKVARLGQLIGRGKLPNFESIDDTLLDTMNYAGLLKAYLRQRADNMTLAEAYKAADEGLRRTGPRPADDEEASEPVFNDEEALAIYNIGQTSDIEVGSIIRLVPYEDEEDDGHRSTFRYQVVAVDDRLKKIEARPTPDWHDSIGDGIRTFRPEQVEVA